MGTVGCGDHAQKGPASAAGTATSPAAETAVDAKVASDTTATSTDVPGSEAKIVVLGTSELTAGIPGKGPLKVAEIKEWLAKPWGNVAAAAE